MTVTCFYFYCNSIVSFTATDTFPFLPSISTFPPQINRPCTTMQICTTIEFNPLHVLANPKSHIVSFNWYKIYAYYLCEYMVLSLLSPPFSVIPSQYYLSQFSLSTFSLSTFSLSTFSLVPECLK